MLIIFILIGFLLAFVGVSEVRNVQFTPKLTVQAIPNSTVEASNVVPNIDSKDVENKAIIPTLYSNADKIKKTSNTLGRIINRTAETFLRLSVDRWIGIEGVMAIQAYPERGFQLIARATKEKRVTGKLDLYQYIAKSALIGADLNKYIFATLPGPIAYFYYSNSMLLVFIGMLSLSFLLFSIEALVIRIAINPLITAWFSINLALGFSQAGIDPYRMFLSIIMNLLGICTLRCIFYFLNKSTRGIL